MLQPGVIRKQLMLMSALNGCKTHSLRAEMRRVLGFKRILSLEKSKCVFQQSEQKELLVVVVFGLWSEVNNLADDNFNGLRQSVS